MKFKQVSAEFKKLTKVGDKVEGRIKAIDLEAKVNDKTRPVVVLENAQGGIEKVPLTDSCKADLAAFSPGEVMRVTLKKTTPSGKGNDFKEFFFERGVEE